MTIGEALILMATFLAIGSLIAACIGIEKADLKRQREREESRRLQRLGQDKR